MTTLNLNQTIECKDFEETVHEPIYHIEAVRGDIVPVMTEDGASDDFAVEIILFNAMTMEPMRALNHVFVGKVVDCGDGDYCYVNSMGLANEMVAKIKERGVIDLAHWDKVQPPQELDLEKEWAADFQREQQERWGY